MKKVFIVHGYEGMPNGAWRPWLMDELRKLNIYACALSMPKPNEPVLSEWINEISRHSKENINDEIYLVGHSLGVPAILRFLENTDSNNIKGAILVSGPVKTVDEEGIESFLNSPFDFGTIKSKVNNFSVIHSDNDEYVSFEHAEILSKELDCELIKVHNGGHFNDESGWTELPQCLDVLRGML